MDGEVVSRQWGRQVCPCHLEMSARVEAAPGPVEKGVEKGKTNRQNLRDCLDSPIVETCIVSGTSPVCPRRWELIDFKNRGPGQQMVQGVKEVSLPARQRRAHFMKSAEQLRQQPNLQKAISPLHRDPEEALLRTIDKEADPLATVAPATGASRRPVFSVHLYQIQHRSAATWRGIARLQCPEMDLRFHPGTPVRERQRGRPGVRAPMPLHDPLGTPA